MNGLMNQNAIVGFALASAPEISNQERLLAGLLAGQMPAGSMMGPLLLKPLIDARVEAERGRATAEAQATGLRQQLQITLPPDERGVTLGVPNATDVKYSAVGAKVDASGKVELEPGAERATVTIAASGVTREISIVATTTTATPAPAPAPVPAPVPAPESGFTPGTRSRGATNSPSA